MKSCIQELKKKKGSLHPVLINELEGMRLQRQQWGTTGMLIVVNSLEDRKHNYTPERVNKRQREQLPPTDMRSHVWI